MITFEDIQNWYRQGKISSPLVERGMKMIATFDREDEILPETLYIGDMAKRGKKGIFRTYDKGLQLDISRFLIMRHELEERGDNAHQSAMRIAKGASSAQCFDSRFKIEDGRWKKIMDESSITIQRGENQKKEISPEESRWKWLIEQVAPTLRKAISAEPMDISKSENFAKFCAAAGIAEKIRELALHISGK
jgi:hypothetical protein